MYLCMVSDVQISHMGFNFFAYKSHHMTIILQLVVNNTQLLLSHNLYVHVTCE